MIQWIEPEPTYETILGLWLNRQRQLYRQGVAIAVGIGFVAQGKKLGKEMAEALAENDMQEQTIADMVKAHDGNITRPIRRTQANQ